MNDVPKIHRCFPNNLETDLLPQPIEGSEIIQAIGQSVSAIMSGPINEITDASKKKSQSGKVRELEKALTNIVPEKINTLRELRLFVDRIRSAIRDAILPNGRPKDKQMDDLIRTAVEKKQRELEYEFHQKIQAQFDRVATEAAEAAEKMKPVIVMDWILSELSKHLGQIRLPGNKVLLAENETVNGDRFTIFLEFVLLLETVIQKPETHSTIQSNMHALIQADTSLSDEQQKLFTEWTTAYIPESIDISGATQSDHPFISIDEKGLWGSMPEYLVLPKKVAILDQRKIDGNDLMWTMTPEELFCARNFYNNERAKRDASWRAEDDKTFLQSLADHVNNRCNANLRLVRADREIREFMKSGVKIDEAIEQATSATTVDELADTTPADDISPTVQPKKKYAPRVPVVSDTTPTIQRLGAALAATKDLQTPISKTDQIARQLLLEFHDHLEARREALASDPESKTSFDEFAIRFLLALTQRASRPLLKPNRTAQSVTFEQKFEVHLEGAAIILNDLRTLLPVHPASSRLDERKKADYLRKTNELLAINTPIVTATKGVTVVVSNKYISQALICSMHADLIDAQTSLRSNATLPANISEAYLRTLYAFCNCVLASYEVDKDSSELTLRQPYKNFVPPTKKFVQVLEIEFNAHDARPKETHEPETDLPAPEATDVVKVPAIEPQAHTTTTIDAAALSHALAKRKAELVAKRAEVQETITTTLQATYSELTAFNLQLTLIRTVSNDPVLDMWLAAVHAEITAINELLPRGIHLDEADDRSKVDLEDLKQETKRLVKVSASKRTAAQTMIAEYHAITAELKAIPAQEKAIQSVVKLQAKLKQAFEVLLPLLPQ